MKKIILCVLVLHGFFANAQPAKSANIIIVTLDGMRWQEVFGGADSALLKNSRYTTNKKPISTIIK
jgi:hypothetical protein